MFRFDYPNPSVVVGKRDVSSTSPQALFLLNNPQVMEYADLAAREFLAIPDIDDARRYTLLTRSILGRNPTESERTVSLAYVQRAENDEQRQQNWARVIQAVFASIDFRYIK